MSIVEGSAPKGISSLLPTSAFAEAPVPSLGESVTSDSIPPTIDGGEDKTVFEQKKKKGAGVCLGTSLKSETGGWETDELRVQWWMPVFAYPIPRGEHRHPQVHNIMKFRTFSDLQNFITNREGLEKLHLGKNPMFRWGFLIPGVTADASGWHLSLKVLELCFDHRAKASTTCRSDDARSILASVLLACVRRPPFGSGLPEEEGHDEARETTKAVHPQAPRSSRHRLGEREKKKEEKLEGIEVVYPGRRRQYDDHEEAYEGEGRKARYQENEELDSLRQAGGVRRREERYADAKKDPYTDDVEEFYDDHFTRRLDKRAGKTRREGARGATIEDDYPGITEPLEPYEAKRAARRARNALPIS
jgi:hypothetical protein